MGHPIDGNPAEPKAGIGTGIGLGKRYEILRVTNMFTIDIGVARTKPKTVKICVRGTLSTSVTDWGGK